jgi:hypothetical protein
MTGQSDNLETASDPQIPVDISHDNQQKNLNNQLVTSTGLSRRNFFKMIGAAAGTAALLSLDLLPDEPASNQVIPESLKSAIDDEDLAMPYEIIVEENNISLSNLNNFMIDRFGMPPSSIGILNITTLPNNSTIFDIDQNFEFASRESILQIIDFCGGINFREAGVNSEEELVSKIQNIFDVVRHGLVSQFAAGSRRLSIEDFRDGIARNLSEVGPKPILGEGNTQVGLLIAAKIIGDFLVYNPDSQTANNLRNHVNPNLIRSTLTNMVRNSTTVEDVAPIPAEYLDNPTGRRFSTENIPLTDLRFVEEYRSQLYPRPVENIEVRMNQLGTNTLNFLGINADSPADPNTNYWEELLAKTQPTAIKERVLGILDTVNFSNQTQEFTELTNFLNVTANLEEFDEIELDEITEEIYQGLSEDQKATYLFFSFIKQSTRRFVNISTDELTDFEQTSVSTRIQETFFRREEHPFIEREIVQVIDLIGFNENYAHDSQHSFASEQDARNAQFYTVMNLYRAAREFARTNPQVEGDNFNNALRVNFKNQYLDTAFPFADTTADLIIKSHMPRVRAAFRGFGNYFNSSETTRIVITSDSSQLNEDGSYHHTTGVTKLKITLTALKYTGNGVILHELGHGTDFKKLAYLTNADERGYRPMDLLLEWAIFSNLSRTLYSGANSEEIDSVTRDDRPWNGFDRTKQHFQSIQSALLSVGIDINPESQEIVMDENGQVILDQRNQEIFNNLRIAIGRVKSNYYHNNDQSLTEAFEQLPENQRKMLLGYVAMFEGDYFEQNLRHKRLGNDEQRLSKMTTLRPGNLPHEEAFVLGTQMLREMFMLRDNRYSLSNMPTEILQLLYKFHPVAPAGVSDIETTYYNGEERIYNVKLLTEVLHDAMKRNAEDSEESVVYKPARIMLAFKLSLMSLYLTDTAAALIRTGDATVNTQFIEDMQIDLGELFSSSMMTSEQKIKFVLELIQDMDAMNHNRGRDALVSTLGYFCTCNTRTDGSEIDMTSINQLISIIEEAT